MINKPGPTLVPLNMYACIYLFKLQRLLTKLEGKQWHIRHILKPIAFRVANFVSGIKQMGRLIYREKIKANIWFKFSYATHVQVLNFLILVILTPLQITNLSYCIFHKTKINTFL